MSAARPPSSLLFLPVPPLPFLSQSGPPLRPRTAVLASSSRHSPPSSSLSNLRAAARENPLDGRLWMRLSRAEPTTPARRAALTTGLHHDPHNAYLHHALAMLAWRQEHDPAAAVAAFHAGIAAHAKGSRGALYQSWALLVATTPDLAPPSPLSATDIFMAGLQDEPGHGPLYVALAETQRRAGLQAAAIATLEKGAETPGARDHAPLWRAYAVLEQRAGRFRSALQKWARAVELQPNEPKTVTHYAELVMHYGEGRAEAAKVLRRAVETASSRSIAPDIIAYGEMVVMLAEAEEKLRGVGVARDILELEAEKFEAMADVWRGVSEKKRKKSSFNMVTKARAALEARDGNYARARELFRRAVEADPDDAPKVLHQWSIWEQRFGFADDARSLLLQGVEVGGDAALWRALGELEMRQGNFDKSRGYFERSVSMRPKDARLWLAWGRAELAAGDVVRAEELFRTAASEEGSADFHGSQSARAARVVLRTRCEAACEAAALALLDGRRQEAQQLLEKGLEWDSSYAAGWRQLAELSGTENGPQAMRRVFSTATRRAPKAVRAKLFHWWGLEEKHLGNVDDSRKFFAEATSRDPGYMSAWLAWGLLEKDQRRPEEACRLFAIGAEHAVEDNIKAPFLFMSWARVEEIDRGNPAEARKVFEKGSTASPRSPELYHGWGLLEERQGCFERAIELYKRGQDLNPPYGSLFQSWGLLEARRRKYDEAARIFELGTTKDPMNAFLWTSWALVEGRQVQNVGRARELFEKATTVDPKFGGAWHAWGALESEMNNYSEARTYFTKAAECDPTSPAAHHSLGVLEGKRGDVPASRKHFEQSITVDPAHSISYQAWALVEERMGGGVTEARRIFEAGVKACGSKNPSLIWQAWALFEDRHDNPGRARALFERGLDQVPNNQTLLQSYGIFQFEQGQVEVARELFERGAKVCPRDAAPVYTAWAQLEASEGGLERARELFNLGLMLNPSHIPGWKAWASMEEAAGNHKRSMDLRMTARGLAQKRGYADEGRIRSPTVLESVNQDVEKDSSEKLLRIADSSDESSSE